MDTSEKNFEAQIEEHLTTHGFIKRDYHDFDAVNAIDSQMLFDFIYATQPETWQKLETQHGSQVKSNFLKRLT